jgi:hypothetical protein
MREPFYGPSPFSKVSCQGFVKFPGGVAIAFHCDRIDIDPPLTPIIGKEPAWTCRKLLANRGFVVNDPGMFRARIVSP